MRFIWRICEERAAMRQGTSNFTWLRFDQSRLDPVREVIVPRIEFIEEISYGSSVIGVFGRGNETRRITLFEDKGQKKSPTGSQKCVYQN